MRFLVVGAVHAEVQAALVKHEHACHALSEISAELAAAGGEAAAAQPKVLIPLLEKKQWNLVTSETEFVRNLYEAKQQFNGVIVLILDDPGEKGDQGGSIDRLFERYKRLTPRRLYTITPSRVKIRQLPGGHED